MMDSNRFQFWNMLSGIVVTPVKYWNSSKDLYVLTALKTPWMEVAAAASA